MTREQTLARATNTERQLRAGLEQFELTFLDQILAGLTDADLRQRQDLLRAGRRTLRRVRSLKRRLTL
jgi:hypothetical protein